MIWDQGLENIAEIVDGAWFYYISNVETVTFIYLKQGKNGYFPL